MTATPANQTTRTIADRMLDDLVQAIVTGAIAPGAKINEATLAKNYAVSRGPLREALRRLEGLRLIEHVPHAGARVVNLTGLELHEIYEVREALEGMAARLAAEKMSGAEIDDLRALLETHEAGIEESSGREYFQQEGDFDFHYRIIHGSGNARLVRLLCGQLYHLVRMYRFRASRGASRPRRALVEHRHILDAIAERDGELAEMLMRRHIAGARRNIEAHIANEENNA